MKEKDPNPNPYRTKTSESGEWKDYNSSNYLRWKMESLAFGKVFVNNGGKGILIYTNKFTRTTSSLVRKEISSGLGK